MPESDEDSDRSGDLRERRRRETLREIADAALDLFERHGVAATTVDQIAHQAGISPRTFFRYCATKEQAVLVGDDGVDRLLEIALREARPGTAPLIALDRAWTRAACEFENDPVLHDRHLRVRRLVRTEPTLLAALLRTDIERAEALSARLRALPGSSPDGLRERAALELIGCIVRLSFEEWSQRVDAGAQEPFSQIHRRVRAAVLDSAGLLAE